MKHFNELTNETLKQVDTGEKFTYKDYCYNGKIFYKKGLKIDYKYMIPISLLCETIESAQK